MQHAYVLLVTWYAALAPLADPHTPHNTHVLPSPVLQRFFSSTLQNFATQSLLMAVGVGAKRALAASAVINWMLKDGMGRLVRMTVATRFGQAFDSDLKVGMGCLGPGAGGIGAVAGIRNPYCMQLTIKFWWSVSCMQ